MMYREEEPLEDFPNLNSFFKFDLIVSKTPLFDILVEGYLIDFNEFIYNFYSHFLKRLYDIEGLLISIYSVLVIFAFFIFFFKSKNKIYHFEKRIIELSDYNILKKILSLNIKKNNNSDCDQGN